MLQQNLKKLRGTKGITQKQLAEFLNISSSTIAMYESGKRDPDTGTLKKLANFFDVSTDYLLGNDIKKKRSTEAEDFEQNVKKIDDNINIVFSDQAGLDDNDVEEIKRFIEFVKSKKK
ncbi:helix-turn-helix transcriptional regulator [Mycoplasmatota bacterium]|nr:helix-turn-helix transcriptional regulator [Mycoplasmatota bacterium]